MENIPSQTLFQLYPRVKKVLPQTQNVSPIQMPQPPDLECSSFSFLTYSSPYSWLTHMCTQKSKYMYRIYGYRRDSTKEGES